MSLADSVSNATTGNPLPPTPQLLNGKDDRYGGFIVDAGSLPAESEFLRVLQNSLKYWSSQIPGIITEANEIPDPSVVEFRPLTSYTQYKQPLFYFLPHSNMSQSSFLCFN